MVSVDQESEVMATLRAESTRCVFECLINDVWVYVPPSIAIYDLSFGGSAQSVVKRLKEGACLNGASGTMYRQSSKLSKVQLRKLIDENALKEIDAMKQILTKRCIR